MLEPVSVYVVRLRTATIHYESSVRGVAICSDRSDTFTQNPSEITCSACLQRRYGQVCVECGE